MVNMFRKKGKRWEEASVATSRKDSESTSRASSFKKFLPSRVNARDDEESGEVSRLPTDIAVEDVETPQVTSPSVKKAVLLPMMRPSEPTIGEENTGHAIVVFHEFGEEALETMSIKEYDAIPEPKNPTDVVIKVKSSTISLIDCTIRRGMWHDTIPLPATPGFDIVGTVAKMGDKARENGRFQEGDRVAALVRTGGNARYATVPTASLVRVPGSVDSAEASCVVSAFVTAYQVLHRERPDAETVSLEGKKILVTGGNGPTGQAMIQLAHLAGAGKIYSTALEKYHGMLRQLGAEPLPLNTSAWLPEVQGRMDFVADSLCQDDFVSPRAALKPGGHLVCTGVAAINNTEKRGWFGQPYSAKYALWKARNIMSNTTIFDLWESFNEKPEVFKRDLEFLLTMLEKEKIKPNLAGRVPLHDVPEAQKKIQEGKIRGMLVCKPWK